MKLVWKTCLILAAVTVLISGCAAQSEEAGRVLTDPAGDEVTVPDQITGVIARVNTASYLAAMGHADLIRGTYKYMANDKWASYMFPELSEAVNLTNDPTPESFYELGANLCIWSDRSMNEALREQGISAVTDLPEDMPGTVRFLADIVGNPEWAERWIRYYDDTMQEIASRLVDVKDRKSVYYVHGAGNQGIFHTAAGGTISETWITESGGEYALQGTTGFGIDITAEELLRLDPDVIVIGGIYYEELTDALLADEALASVKAIQDDEIYHVPVGLIPWDQYGVEYPLLCLWTAKTLYPEAFADVDMVAETQAFYKDICGVTLSEQEVQRMLDGKSPDGGSLVE